MSKNIRNGRSSSPSTPADAAVPQVLQAPQQPAAPQAPHQPVLQMVNLNWSHFRPEFSGKPDEDAEAHLLCIYDWMNADHFVEGVKVQRYCLTLQ